MCLLCKQKTHYTQPHVRPTQRVSAPEPAGTTRQTTTTAAQSFKHVERTESSSSDITESCLFFSHIPQVLSEPLSMRPCATCHVLISQASQRLRTGHATPSRPDYDRVKPPDRPKRQPYNSANGEGSISALHNSAQPSSATPRMPHGEPFSHKSLSSSHHPRRCLLCSARQSQSRSSTRRQGRPPSPPYAPRSHADIMKRSSLTMRGPEMCVPDRSGRPPLCRCFLYLITPALCVGWLFAQERCRRWHRPGRRSCVRRS